MKQCSLSVLLAFVIFFLPYAVANAACDVASGFASYTNSDNTVVSFNGATAYVNGNCEDGKFGCGACQCVDFVKRVFPKKITGSTGNGMYVCDNISDRYGFTYHKNGSVAPKTGDVLCFKHADKVGHVGIISHVDTTAGSEHVIMMDQNRSSASATIKLTLTSSGGTYTIGTFDSKYTPTGFARNPDYAPAKVGHTSTGPSTPGNPPHFTPAFETAYAVKGGEGVLGKPFNVNNGTAHVHEWPVNSSVWAQDFLLGDTFNLAFWHQLSYNTPQEQVYLLV